MDEPVRFISTIQVGITVFGIAMGSVGEPLISQYFDTWLSHALAYLLSFLILTYLTVVLGSSCRRRSRCSGRNRSPSPLRYRSS